MRILESKHFLLAISYVAMCWQVLSMQSYPTGVNQVPWDSSFLFPRQTPVLPPPTPSSVADALEARNVGGRLVYNTYTLPSADDFFLPISANSSPLSPAPVSRARGGNTDKGKKPMTAKDSAEGAFQDRMLSLIDMLQHEYLGELSENEAWEMAWKMYQEDIDMPNAEYLMLDSDREILLGGQGDESMQRNDDEGEPSSSKGKGPLSPPREGNPVQAECQSMTSPRDACDMGSDDPCSGELCAVCFNDIGEGEGITKEECPCHWEQFCRRCMNTMRTTAMDKLKVLRCPLCRDTLPLMEVMEGQLTRMLHSLVLSRGPIPEDGPKVLQRLLEGGADPNALVMGGYHNTAIHIAGINGHGEYVKVLCDWPATDLNAVNYANQVPLHYAAEGGSALAVRSILSSGRVNFASPRDQKQETPLHFASNHGFVEVCKVLAEYGADMNARNAVKSTPLVLAGSRGFTQCVDTLYQLGAGINGVNGQENTGLHMACFHGHIKTARWFMNTASTIRGGMALLNRPNIDGNTSLSLAARKGHAQIIALLLENGADQHIRNKFGELPLHAAAFLGQSVVIPVLMNAKGAPKVNAVTNIGRTALHYAAAHNRYDTAVTLIQLYNADVNVKDMYGDTPLHLASGSGHGNLVNLLLKHKKIIQNVRNLNDELPIHRAAASGDMEVITALLDAFEALPSRKRGYPIINSQSSTGQTPLHFAAANGHLDAVFTLLRRGGSIQIKDNDGRRPFDVAKKDGNPVVIEVLRV